MAHSQSAVLRTAELLGLKVQGHSVNDLELGWQSVHLLEHEAESHLLYHHLHDVPEHLASLHVEGLFVYHPAGRTAPAQPTPSQASQPTSS